MVKSIVQTIPFSKHIALKKKTGDTRKLIKGVGKKHWNIYGTKEQ